MPRPRGMRAGGRQTALTDCPPRRVAGCVPPRPPLRRAAATASTHTHAPCPAAAPDALPLAPAH
eukprot:4369213-Prymnesium_polylepis.1